jgi:hypothetical protein
MNRFAASRRALRAGRSAATLRTALSSVAPVYASAFKMHRSLRPSAARFSRPKHATSSVGDL